MTKPISEMVIFLLYHDFKSVVHNIVCLFQRVSPTNKYFFYK